MSEAIKKSMQLLQAEAQQLLLQSGYEHSLVRYHKMTADLLDSQIDSIAKKIRNLEQQIPKEKMNEPIKEGSDSNTESGSLGNPEE